MPHHPRTANPIDLLIDLRRAKDRSVRDRKLADSLVDLLTLLNAPPKLPGLLRIAENILAILGPDSGVPIPEGISSRLPGWTDNLAWIVSNADEISTKVFIDSKMRERFLCTMPTNPVLGHGAIASPIYCQLWEAHPDSKYIKQFRILQGHMMFAHLDVRKKLASAASSFSIDEQRVASNHLYRTTYPLQDIAKLQTLDSVGEPARQLFASVKAGFTRDAFAEALWECWGKLPPGSDLRHSLSAVVRQLDWSLNSSYQPEPKLVSANSDARIRKDDVSDPELESSNSPSEGSGKGPSTNLDSAQPKRELNDPVPGPLYVVTTDVDKFDEVDDNVFRDDAEKESSPCVNTSVIRHTRVPAEDPLAQTILATGDHPGKYLPSDSTDLTENARGVLLDGGGWQEMRNQYLPWSLSELMDEELADAWRRLEQRAQTLEPDSVELFALVNVLLWTGRLPKDVMRLEVRSTPGDPAGELCFQLSSANSSMSDAEWRMRPLPVPLTPALVEPVQREGARRCVPVFALPDYAGVEGFIRQVIALRTNVAGNTVYRLFDKDLAYYKKQLKQQLAADTGGVSIDSLNRVTLERISFSFFQRIVDLTAGDLVAVSLITGRDVRIARDDRFYATPSIVSLRNTYRRVVQSIRSDLIPLKCSLPRIQVVESGTEESSVGSTICPTVEHVRRAVLNIRSQVTAPPLEAHSLKRFDGWINQHNAYTLYTLLMVGWVVGFRAVSDPFIYPNELDWQSGLTAFQDKGPQDRSKSRLARLPGLALAQIQAYLKYQSDCAVFMLNEMNGQLCFIEKVDRGIFFRRIRPSAIEEHLEKYLPLPANASRHFGRTEWVERNYCPQYASVWLSHFFRGEEPWGKYSTFRFADYCRFMDKELPKILKQDLGFEAIDNDGQSITDYHPDLERFRRRGKARARPSGKN